MNHTTKMFLGITLLAAAIAVGIVLFQQGGYLHIRALPSEEPTQNTSTFSSQEKIDEYTQRESYCLEMQNEKITTCEQVSNQEDAREDCTVEAVEAMLRDCLIVE